MLLFTEKNAIQSCMQEILRWLFQISDVIYGKLVILLWKYYEGLSNIKIYIKINYGQLEKLALRNLKNISPSLGYHGDKLAF